MTFLLLMFGLLRCVFCTVAGSVDSHVILSLAAGGTQSSAESKEKAPLPKAMVKPHVLTHVIDGFIIQEGGSAAGRRVRHGICTGS